MNIGNIASPSKSILPSHNHFYELFIQ